MGRPGGPLPTFVTLSRACWQFWKLPKSAIHNETFNVGRTDENYRISELADIVAEIVPGCNVEYAAGGGPDKRCYRVSCEKIRRVLPNFQPQWTARKGAQELYDAYRAVGLTREDVERGRYVRMNHIQRLLDARALESSLRWKAPAERNAFPVGSGESSQSKAFS